MQRFFGIGLLVVAIAAGVVLPLEGQPRAKDMTPPPGEPTDHTLTTPQVLMRDKLTYAKDALDGLSLGDFAEVARSAKMLRLINRACSRYVLDSEEYNQCCKNFQEQTADLERHALERNLDAAALDYTRIALTCVQCHKYVRKARAGKLP